MNRRLLRWLSVALIFPAACEPQQSLRPERVAASTTIALTHGTVLPMADGSASLADHTVLVEDGVIVAIGPTGSVTIPAGAIQIDLGKRFVLPGLIDSHTHVRTIRDLNLYLAAGVTTVVSLGQSSTVEAMRARPRVDSGLVAGPRILAAVFIDGPASPIAPLADATAVATAVAGARASGNALVKLYNALTPSQFEAAVAEARRQSLPVFGHAVRSISLPYALTHGQQVVAHAEEYLYSFFENREDDARIQEAARFTRDAGAAVIPNLSAYDVIAAQWGNPSWISRIERDPDFARLDSARQVAWRNSDYVKRPGSLGTRPQFLRRVTKALGDAGVPLMAGTDSPTIPGMFPGSSLATELMAMVDAGISPTQALRAATSNPGDFLYSKAMVKEPIGRIVVGGRADLLILEGDPLADLRNLRTVAAVMARGHWYARSALDRLF